MYSPPAEQGLVHQRVCAAQQDTGCRSEHEHQRHTQTGFSANVPKMETNAMPASKKDSFCRNRKFLPPDFHVRFFKNFSIFERWIIFASHLQKIVASKFSR